MDYAANAIAWLDQLTTNPVTREPNPYVVTATLAADKVGRYISYADPIVLDQLTMIASVYATLAACDMLDQRSQP